MSTIANNYLNLNVAAPAISLCLLGFTVVVISLLKSKASAYLYLSLSLAGLVIAAGLTAQLWDSNDAALGNMMLADNFALVFNWIFLLGATLSILLAFGEYESKYLLYPEFFAVILFATVGMMLMAASNNLLIMFLGLETLSISLYVLAALKRTEERSLEASFKYFLLGAFSSAFLLYGIAFIYGATGELGLHQVSAHLLAGSHSNEPFMVMGGVLILIGLGFKVAMFPFHMWTPDVYQGAPTPIAAFMSTGSKAAGFSAMLRVLYSATNGRAGDWMTILSILAVLTMFAGNFGALVQKNLKRMLAYSSIAHAGYILLGIVAWNEVGGASVIFYLLVYTFMNVGAFGVVALLSSAKKETAQIEDLRGLAFEKPLPALVMAVFMFALAGLPPTAGFMGKFYLFSAAVKAGHIWLVIIAVLNSVISLYYYLRVVVTMFMEKSEKESTFPAWSPAVYVSLTLAMLASIGLGIFPSYLMNTFEHVVGSVI